MIKYGLTCISELLRDKDKSLAYKTMTRKQFLSMSRDDSLMILSSRILHNVELASKVVKHCYDNDIKHYRIPQGFPLMTDPVSNVSWNELPHYPEIINAIKNIGDTARKYNIRIGSHPDQFVILSSPSSAVIEKSIIDLQQNGWFFDTMGLPRSHEAPINIHTSCSIKPGSSLQQIGDRIYNALMKCGESVYKRFTLENEDKSSFTCAKLYELHNYIKDTHKLSIPLVFDNLHHSINNDDSDTNWLEIFKSTWPKDIVPVMHWSEGGLNGNKRAHVDYITEAVGKPIDDSVIWELEVKAKDKAIIRLLRE